MPLDRYRRFLDRRQAGGQLRRLRAMGPGTLGRIQIEGRWLVNLASNDTLGLAFHPALRAAAQRWADEWGVGSGAARLVGANPAPLAELEARLAGGLGSEAALLLNSGFQANASLLAALLDRTVLGAEPLVFSDRLNHASLHFGCAAAGVHQHRYRHLDLDHLESLLQRHAARPGPRFIITESVFSMEGDQVDLAGLLTLKERYGAFLYLDEAHAFGVLGPAGWGLAAAHPSRVDLVLGTCGKALGSYGAVAACSATLREYLINRAAGFVYATALPPPVLGAIAAAVELLPGPELTQARQRLAGHGVWLRQALNQAGLDTGRSTTHIVPVMMAGANEALATAARLERAGFLAPAIRPPTVPSSRLRLSLCAAHQRTELARLVEHLALLQSGSRERVPWWVQGEALGS